MIHADDLAENAVERFEDDDDNFGVDVSIEDVFFVIHADDLAENAVERFEDGDDNFGVDVSIDDGVNTRACNAASGVTTSGTTGNFATTVLRGKRTLREFFSSSDSPLPCLHLAATLSMIAWLGLMMSLSSFFFCDV